MRTIIFIGYRNYVFKSIDMAGTEAQKNLLF